MQGDARFDNLLATALARTDLYYFACDWEPTTQALARARTWRLFWDAFQEASPVAYRSALPFAELLDGIHDLSSGERARGAAWFYGLLGERLEDEARSEWDRYLGQMLPLGDRLPNELGADVCLPDPDYEVWLSLRPATVAELRATSSDLDPELLRAAGDDLRSDDAYVPDFDSFASVLSGHRSLLRRLHKTNAGLVVMASF